jgi:cytochrome c556
MIASVFSVRDDGTRILLILSSRGQYNNISAGPKSQMKRYAVKKKINYDVSDEAVSRVIKNVEPVDSNYFRVYVESIVFFAKLLFCRFGCG